MAFFGEDGLQRQLKQAQKDIMAKGKSDSYFGLIVCGALTRTLDREIGTMHLSAKEKDEASKKLRQEIERLQEEKMDMADGAGPVSRPCLKRANSPEPQSRPKFGGESSTQDSDTRLAECYEQTADGRE